MKRLEIMASLIGAVVVCAGSSLADPVAPVIYNATCYLDDWNEPGTTYLAVNAEYTAPDGTGYGVGLGVLVDPETVAWTACIRLTRQLCSMTGGDSPVAAGFRLAGGNGFNGQLAKVLCRPALVLSVTP
jgi:hypothetical protein